MNQSENSHSVPTLFEKNASVSVFDNEQTSNLTLHEELTIMKILGLILEQAAYDIECAHQFNTTNHRLLRQDMDDLFEEIKIFLTKARVHG